MRKHWFIFPPIAIAVVFLLSAAVMLLWNALLPPLLNVGTVTYWQALGLLILSRLLFGGFHRGWGHHRRHSHFLAHRWMQMSDEEREKVRHEWKSRCGWCPPPAGQTDQPS